MLRRYSALVLASVLGVALAGCGGKTAGKSPGKTMEKSADMRAYGYAPAMDSPAVFGEGFNTETYDRIYENSFLSARQNPLSTFAIDVDTAAYANVRRFLGQGQLPPKDAVRIEELINYFTYAYAPPTDGKPFSACVEVSECPWNAEHRLARIALKGREVPPQERPPCNLVFLLDVSGSMHEPNKLPLVKAAMRMLLQNLAERDRLAIVVYAGAAGLVLPSTSCAEKGEILPAIDRLQAGGSTAGGAGLQLAYQTAAEHFSPEKVNRVVLCTDGDFNVGVSDQGSLVRMIEEKARGGVSLTVLGFGMGNYKDSTLEKLADKGHGNYGYIDTVAEARKLLVEQLSGTLVTIAKDVKIQIEWNPARVAAYRLIGYENRLLRAEEFHDDAKSAGDIGAGHTVTALYELAPPGTEGNLPKVDDLKYQQPAPATKAAESDETFTIKLRYKLPAADTSELVSFPVSDPGGTLDKASGDFRFAAAVACWGMLLRDSQHKGNAGYDLALQLARSGKGEDKNGYRSEFIRLVESAKALTPPSDRLR